jgi:hypothetical protein
VPHAIRNRTRAPAYHLYMKLFILLAALSDCPIADADRAFVAHALQTWDKVRVKHLQVTDAARPRLIFFDERCVFDGDTAAAHGGMVKLPGGEEVPARLMTFASAHEDKPYLVQALPALWRAEERHRNNPNLDQIMRAVFVHEMTHTAQTKAFGDRIGTIERQYKIENLDDDIVQRHFAENAEYVAAYEKERDLLYAIAAKPDRELAKQAVRMVKERRARFFTGDQAHLAELEEIFLGMEGAAQWAAFRAVMEDGATREEAIAAMTRSRRWWSQDEGLALFLAIDALMPGKWQKKVFGGKATPVWALLEEGAR